MQCHLPNMEKPFTALEVVYQHGSQFGDLVPHSKGLKRIRPKFIIVCGYLNITITAVVYMVPVS